MPTASLSFEGCGLSMPGLSHTVNSNASPIFHSLAKAVTGALAHTVDMDKNNGPNFLQAWREHREMTQEQLAEKVGTTASMISMLEAGERGLSAKWLRRLAPALDTTPGHLLDSDPHVMDSDIIDIWMRADQRQRRQLADIAKAIVRTGTND